MYRKEEKEYHNIWESGVNFIVLPVARLDLFLAGVSIPWNILFAFFIVSDVGKNFYFKEHLRNIMLYLVLLLVL